MGLLDDVPMPKRLPTTGRYRTNSREFEIEENFKDLQNLGHTEQSADFSDSAFADRQPIKEEEQI